MESDAGDDLVLKPSPYEAEIKRLRAALEEIKSTAGWQTGPVGRILEIIRRLASEALETSDGP